MLLNMCFQQLFRKIRRHKFIFFFITLGLLIILAINNYYEVTLISTDSQDQAIIHDYTSELYAVNTGACKIPNIQRMYPGSIPAIPRSPSCRKARDVGIIKEDDQVVVLGERFMDKKYNCTLSEIKISSKTGFEFSNPEKIVDSLDISEKELIITRCLNYYNLDANFPLNVALQEKLDFWDSKEDIPFSVLFLGFGSHSRTKFYKTVPKSVRSMLELMGFIEFEGYHSLAPYPFENFLGFLAGLRNSSAKNCHPTQRSSFDTCPFIWKNYHENDYVTMFMEDGSESFTWDGMGAFNAKPTDFYTHPLFQSRLSLRKRFPIKGLSPLCVSRFNPQAFLYDYTQKFYKKFIDYPFFGFVWSNYMTHSKSRFTSGTDDGFSKLLFVLRSFPEALERTFIIVASDQGNEKVGPAGFLEKSLPGLFIRVPQVLENKFRELQINRTLKANAKRLITPLDIHHTLQHLLVLNGMSFSSSSGNSAGKVSLRDFKPILKDRSSLLVPISEKRNCKDLNIQMSYCACNASSDVPAWESPLSKILMIDFVIQELNTILSNGTYKEKCIPYIPAKAPIVSTDVTKTEDGYSDGVLKFLAEPERRVFQVTLRVIHEHSTLDRLERLSDFTRGSENEKSSWCPELDGIEDEMVKRLCTC